MLQILEKFENKTYPHSCKCLFAFFLLFVSLVIIYSNSFNGTWVFDDNPNIVDNENIQMKKLSWDNIVQSFQGRSNQEDSISRPLAYLSFAINFYLDGKQVFGYHLINFLVHFLAAIFLYLFILNILKLPLLRDSYQDKAHSIALLASFIWAIHPIQVTAVTYIVQRMTSMAALFYILSMYFYLKGRMEKDRKNQILFFLGCGIAAVCAFASKENAAMLPVSIFVFDLLLIQGVSKRNLIKNLKIAIVPFLLVLFLGWSYTDLTSILSGYENRPFDCSERLLTESRVFIFYISLLVYPIYSRLTLLQDIQISESLFSPWTTLPSVFLLAGVVALGIYLARKRPLIAFCIFFFLINHVIEGSIISLELIFEHRNYLPSMFFFLPLAIGILWALEHYSYQKPIQILMIIVLVFILSGMGRTVQKRNNIYKDPFLLYAATARKSPELSRPHMNLGVFLLQKGYPERALQSFKKAKSLDRYLNQSNKVKTFNNLGRHYLRHKEKPQKAKQLFEKGLKLNPKHKPGYINLIQALIRAGQTDKAHAVTQKASKFWPENYQLQYLQSLILLRKERYDNCLQVALSAFDKKQSRQVYKIIGEIFRRKGKLQKSVYFYEKAFENKRSDLETQCALFYIYSKLDKEDKLNKFLGVLDYKRQGASWKKFISKNVKQGFTILDLDLDKFLELVREYYLSSSRDIPD